ncbi:hypothetical protein KIN20_037140 [Parelaphostrongylus tenuis]|uniref:Uncharacterized protein n=1 Tax=Parelaphostrongylus tenuis TaxID=148309 RepID=A0AAD5WL33_PARTN|nr:hypothetical protein KIN20_037140 [Parelaphostrongylus tenuis]
MDEARGDFTGDELGDLWMPTPTGLQTVPASISVAEMSRMAERRVRRDERLGEPGAGSNQQGDGQDLVMGVDLTQKRKKAVNWCSQENDLIIKLFLASYNTYYFKFSDGSKKGIKAVRETLHEKWAEELTNLRFAKRTPAQVAEKIKKSIILTRKFINTNGENFRSGRSDDLPPHLKPLEKKLREEYSKQSNGGGFDLSIDDTALRFYDVLKNVKEESLSPMGGINPDEGRCGEVDLDIESGANDNVERSSLSILPHVSAVAHVFDLPPVAPVTPFKNSTILPSVVSKSKKRTYDEDTEDINVKRNRLIDAEMELLQRKRYLLEMKIKYWEGKIKRSSN